MKEIVLFFKLKSVNVIALIKILPFLLCYSNKQIKMDYYDRDYSHYTNSIFLSVGFLPHYKLCQPLPMKIYRFFIIVCQCDWFFMSELFFITPTLQQRWSVSLSRKGSSICPIFARRWRGREEMNSHFHQEH